MYAYHRPEPIIINLSGQQGFELRQAAADYVARNPNVSGAERGSLDQQTYGALAEIVVRDHLGLPRINPQDHPLAYDFAIPGSNVKVDVKCRGGKLAFQELYASSDGIPREAKHNFLRAKYTTIRSIQTFMS